MAKKKDNAFMALAKSIFPSLGRTSDYYEEGTQKSKAELAFPGMNGQGRTMFTIGFDGETSLGEMGPIKNYLVDYQGLRARSYQAYIESLPFKTIADKYVLWIIGKGLNLQCQPAKNYLEAAGIKIDTQKFCKSVESGFNVFINSKLPDYSGQKTGQQLFKRNFRHSWLGGDVLVILRVENKLPTMQMIDGAHVQSPTIGSDWWPAELPNGNKIIHGIEMDLRGRHVRYYIRQRDYSFQTVEAYDKATGLRMAYLTYGSEFRLDNHRGLPALGVGLEKLKKMDRYDTATLGTAEELAKISYQIVHESFSTGESPLQQQLAKMRNIEARTIDGDPRDISGKQLAATVAATTQKQTYNNAVGSEIKPMQNGNGTQVYKDYYGTNHDEVAAAALIPPSVARSQYTDSFSASRAAIGDWGHVMDVSRWDYSCDANQPFYELYLHCAILDNKVQAPGYLLAFSTGDQMVLAAYRMTAWSGDIFPHIDPVKEATAQRIKLGPMAAAWPLTTQEAAIKALNEGDSDHVVEQFATEMGENTDRGFVVAVPAVPGEDSNKKKENDKEEQDD